MLASGPPTQIPRRIIQTGKGGQQSTLVRACVSSVRTLNPDFEHLFFDDAQVEEFVRAEFPQHFPTFNSFRHPPWNRAQPYDFFRYLAIFCYGGFYFDVDVLTAASLASLLDKGCVFPFERLTFSRHLRSLGVDWEIGNYAFGASPGHPFIGALIEGCIRVQRDPSWLRPMLRGTPPLQRDTYFGFYSTGPGLCSRTLAENPELGKTVTVLFPEDVRDTRTWYHFGDLGIHLMQGTWRPKVGRLLGAASYYSWRLKERNLQKRSRRLGKTRQHPRQASVAVRENRP